MTLMQGLDAKSLKKHPSLIPLFVVLGFGCATAILYTARLATKNPDVSWHNKSKPEPWNDYKDKNYKILNPVEGQASMQRIKSLWDM